MSSAETSARFPCFGSTCAVHVSGPGRLGSAELAVALSRRRLEDWHRRFSRFEPDSELSRLNRDPRIRVPVSAAMARFVAAATQAAQRTSGLVDSALCEHIERAGYAHDLSGSLPLAAALREAPARRPASCGPRARWHEISVDRATGEVSRPPGVRLDSGGLAKGLFADLLAEALGSHASFAVDCGGDVRVGGTSGRPRRVDVASPFDGSTVHGLDLVDGGVATSGIGKRSWRDAEGAPAHHLLDPATGRPAFTGLVQATALAPTALEAEALAKAAVLSGPAGARRWLPHGGVLVLDDGSVELVEDESRAPLSGNAQGPPRAGSA